MKIYQTCEVTHWGMVLEPCKGDEGEWVRGGAALEALTVPNGIFRSVDNATDTLTSHAKAFWEMERNCGVFSNEGDDPGDFPGLSWELDPGHPRVATGGAFQHGEAPNHPLWRCTISGRDDALWVGYIYGCEVL